MSCIIDRLRIGELTMKAWLKRLLDAIFAWIAGDCAPSVEENEGMTADAPVIIKP